MQLLDQARLLAALAERVGQRAAPAHQLEAVGLAEPLRVGRERLEVGTLGGPLAAPAVRLFAHEQQPVPHRRVAGQRQAAAGEGQRVVVRQQVERVGRGPGEIAGGGLRLAAGLEVVRDLDRQLVDPRGVAVPRAPAPRGGGGAARWAGGVCSYALAWIRWCAKA